LGNPTYNAAGVQEILGYEVLGTLGFGARSTIYAVKDRDHQVYALKRVVKETPSDQRFLEQAILEHEVASQFNHAVLRRSFKLIRQRRLITTSEVLVLMEMVDGLTMEQYKARDVVHLCQLCQQVASGLGQMHLANYVHADIKPNNILVTEKDQVKIIDFGQSCPIGTVKQRIQGTPDYIAPEQVLRREITPATDVFNLGATIYWLLTNQHVPTLIPKGTSAPDFRGKLTCAPPRELNPKVPPALSTLVMHCVEIEPKDRPTDMQQVSDRLGIAILQLTRQPGSHGGNGQQIDDDE
jgi:serine/threonine-protein kinase